MSASQAIYPKDPDALYAYAFSLHQAGNVEEAIPLYQQLHVEFPNHSDLLTLYGTALLQAKNLPDGIRILEKSIQLFPNQPIALSNIANGFYNLKQFETSILFCDKSIAIDQNYPAAHNNRADALMRLNRFEEALISCERAIALKPDYAEAYSTRGNVLSELKRYVESLVSYDRAISLNPNLAEAYSNKATVFNELKRFSEALENCDNAIKLKPDFANAFWNKSFIKLTLGEYEEGWKLYEWRWKSSQAKQIRIFDKPLWLGDVSISGKTILIYPEQGLGDLIQMSRYVSLLNGMGAKVVLEIPSPLVSLFTTLEADVYIAETGKSLPNFDFQCPIMSLPLAFKTVIESIPANFPYLSSDVIKKTQWRASLGQKIKPRIGIVCSGSTTHKDDSKRSIPLKLFAPLLNLPFEFHILQKEIREEDLMVLETFPHINVHHEKLIDFSDTAALIEEMDLLISVDTSVLHLAGALGKTVWAMIPWVPDFRWLLDRSDSPWYPTMKLFRQPELGNWQAAIDEVCQRLKGLSL